MKCYFGQRLPPEVCVSITSPLLLYKSEAGALGDLIGGSLGLWGYARQGYLLFFCCSHSHQFPDQTDSSDVSLDASELCVKNNHYVLIRYLKHIIVKK